MGTDKAVSLPELVRELAKKQKELTRLDAKVMQSMEELPDAVANVKKNFRGHGMSVHETLEDTVEDAEHVKELVDMFNERIGKALKEALHFNALVKKQNDWKDDQLPPEVMDSAGPVVTDLQRAKKLGRNLMKHDAAEMIKVAKRVKMKMGMMGGEDGVLVGAVFPRLPGSTESSEDIL